MKVKNKDRIKRQNKKTIRSEMVNMLVWTSIMTMLLVGGGLSVIIFQWSSIALREDMDLYGKCGKAVYKSSAVLGKISNISE